MSLKIVSESACFNQPRSYRGKPCQFSKEPFCSDLQITVTKPSLNLTANLAAPRKPDRFHLAVDGFRLLVDFGAGFGPGFCFSKTSSALSGISQ